MNTKSFLLLCRRYAGLLIFVGFSVLAFGWFGWAIREAVRFPWSTPTTPPETPFIVGGLLLISVGLAPAAMFAGLAYAGWRWFGGVR
jgi:hypothetical protein